MFKTRPKPYIIPISVGDLSLSDKNWLELALDKDYNGGTLDSVLQSAVTGFCQIWRIENGIIVTEIIPRKEGQQLWLTHLAGKGIFKNQDLVEAWAVDYAKAQDCNSIRWAGMNKGLERIYSRRWKKIAAIYERKV